MQAVWNLSLRLLAQECKRLSASIKDTFLAENGSQMSTIMHQLQSR